MTRRQWRAPARGGPDTLDNLVCTSQLMNSAKAHWTLEELGWHPRPRGSLQDWDGLLGWFMSCVSAKMKLREQPFFRQWHRAAEKALKSYEPQEDLPSGLRPPFRA